MKSKDKNGKYVHKKVGKPNYMPSNKSRSTIKQDPDTFRTDNSPELYFNNRQAAVDASNVAYSTPLGTKVNLRNTLQNSDNSVITDAIPDTIPGVLRIGFVPTIGSSDGGSSAVNIAARQIYSWVRHANSGSRNYESPDYMMYLLALDSAYMFHAELVRLYGLFATYSYKNRYVNRTLVEAAGFDYEDIQANLPQLRYLINQFGVKLNTFACPKQMSLFDRHTMLALNVYADSKLDMSSFYLFKPQVVWMWDGTTESTGTSLQPHVNIGINALATYDDIQEQINDILSSLISNEDVGIMSGDTLRSFTESGIREIAMIPEDTKSVAIYDEGVLSQIHNMTYLGTVALNPIVQNETGDIITSHEVVTTDSVPAVFNTYKVQIKDQILDSGMESPTPEFTMEATRLKYACEIDNDITGSNLITTCGTEIVSSLDMYTLLTEDGQTFLSYKFPAITAVPGMTAFLQYNVPMQTFYRNLLLLSTFDWAPIVNNNVQFSGTEPIQLTTLINGPIFNYTVISEQNLYNMNEVALQSLLNVYGTYISKK